VAIGSLDAWEVRHSVDHVLGQLSKLRKNLPKFIINEIEYTRRSHFRKTFPTARPRLRIDALSEPKQGLDDITLNRNSTQAHLVHRRGNGRDTVAMVDHVHLDEQGGVRIERGSAV
jgi:hypothetical protein